MVRNQEGSRGLATASGILVCSGEGTGTVCLGPPGLAKQSGALCSVCTHGTAVQCRGSQGMAPPASKLANGEICVYSSNPRSSAQTSTSAASLNLLHFAMKYVLCAEVDNYSVKKQKLTYSTHILCHSLAPRKGLLLVSSPSKISTFSLGKTWDWSLLFLNCHSSDNLSEPALETNRCNYSPVSNKIKQNKNTSLGAGGLVYSLGCFQKAGCFASCQCRRNIKSLGFMKHLAAISQLLGFAGQLYGQVWFAAFSLGDTISLIREESSVWLN